MQIVGTRLTTRTATRMIGGSQLEAGQEQLPGLAYARLLTDEEAAQSKATSPDFTSLICSFCGKSRAETQAMFAGPGVYICGECVALCAEALLQETPGTSASERA
jgi:hypothetical protein